MGDMIIREDAVYNLASGQDYTDEKGNLYALVATKVLGTFKGLTSMETVFRYKGALWMFDWSEGTTDAFMGDVDGDRACHRVEARTVVTTTTEYLPVGNGEP